ncbi:carbohydrate binding family 9 domain-containing protein [Flavobacterium sp. HXWNR29]|uniref:carbohydrate binding family 9 domain-containing protein n=1 Tax=Flavobacterium odoriferum TaxID=2946604 RepID=UPI0021CAF270|nr:carbohydrate binding family 9 domain-containing protein [Flavobacterium sp. HXWNR29]MCU4189696.1 carbohydrate binding family 9 domain-containing protein [Flavobacterium sp. HXWNR29]
MVNKSSITLLFCIAGFFFSFSQTKKSVSTKKTTENISIDAELNEASWKDAEIATDFVSLEPKNGTPIPEEFKTEVKILYSNDAIYIGAKLYDPNPEKILKELVERDEIGTSDFFGIFINGYNDGQQEFRFFVTAANGQVDTNFTSSEGEDGSWNAIWESNAKITDFGYVIEMKIPYAALRFPEKDKQIWGLNFFREVRRERQKYTWSPIDNKIGAISQQAGLLTGIENIKTPTRLFLIPYSSFYLSGSETQKTKGELKGGLDIKYGINDAFTLDAILVPDFGQTKFDNVVLNLGPFEQQFNENRPFFTEGTDLFSKGNLLYSRRIGQTPDLNLNLTENESINEYPGAINLVNALKISGRDKDGLGIGFLNAITEKTIATATNSDDNSTRQVEISPLTNYNVMVFDQRFNQNSSITFINTNVTRNGSFRDANVTGLLFDLNNKTNTYNLSGGLKSSSINDVENKNGYNASLYFAETNGKFRYSFGSEYMSKDFEINDLGINFRTNYYSFSGNTNYRILNPNKTFNTFRINLNSYFEFYTPTNQIQASNFNVNLNSTNKKNHFFGGGIDFNPFKNYDYYEPRVTNRFFVKPETAGGWLYFSSNYNNKFAIDFEPFITHVINENRYEAGVNISPRYRFSDKFSLVYGFNYFKQKNDIGFIDFEDSNIIFARRDRDTYTNSITSKFSISSVMNFNLSVRHYWSLAENNKINNLNEDGSLSINNTYTGNRNSNFSTWNLDLSYSWWFAPGSQMSILYRNNAGTFDRTINKDFGSNFSNLFEDNLNHVLSVSVRYFIDYNQAKNWIKKG